MNVPATRRRKLVRGTKIQEEMAEKTGMYRAVRKRFSTFRAVYFLNREGAHQCSPSGEEDNSDRNYLLNHEREGFNVPRVVKEMM